MGEITFEVPNLDAQWPDELYKLANVLDTLGTYAIRKAQAMGCRSAGEITAAVEHEAQCQKLYEKLPQWARW